MIKAIMYVALGLALGAGLTVGCLWASLARTLHGPRREECE